MTYSSLIQRNEAGLYCAAGDFYVDPWKPVASTAIITHAHSDHARPGSRRYVCSREGHPLLRLRMGDEASIESFEFGESRRFGRVTVSLHPAGHIRGSAQVRIQGEDAVAVVSGDFKRDADPTATAFEVLRCDEFVTESTFGLPIYRWPDSRQVITEIDQWWRDNQSQGKASILFAYALGKAQRILAELDASIGPMFVHGAVQKICDVYRSADVALPHTTSVIEAPPNTKFTEALIVAPPSASGTPWMRRFRRSSTGLASGWMRIRGMRRRRSIDRGFVISDHADWPALMQTIEETGAKRIFATHGYAGAVAARLREQGKDASPLETAFQGESLDQSETEESEGQ